MAFSSITRALQRSPLVSELLTKLDQQGLLVLNGVARLPKGLVASALAQAQQRPLLVVTATLEEAGRWATQLEAMGWDTVHFYPTSEASPYDPFDQESEMTWGQLQVLADLLALRAAGAEAAARKLAIVATERALQPHLPPVSALEPYCLRLELKQEINFKELGQRLATLGYERVTVVETEGQWAQRGDIIDVYPVASELPVRLELFGDELERLREFDPATQRSLDAIDHLVLTPTQYGSVIIEHLRQQGKLGDLLSEAAQEGLESGIIPEGTRRWLGLAFSQPASLLDYLP
ncbi:MAG TPA: transcription-repair coupling factor, partial [Nodosilinea sp.]|nr:transcription-repair coupling factor [Nodosilinea sp.]